MKKILIAGAVAAFAVTPALAQQAIVRGDSEQARSQMSQTQPNYYPAQRRGYVATFNHGYSTGYTAAPSAPSGYMQAAPYASVGGPYASVDMTYGFAASGVDGAFNPGVSDQERTLYSQHAPIQGWPGDPQRGFW